MSLCRWQASASGGVATAAGVVPTGSAANPFDFESPAAIIARAYGIRGERVNGSSELEPALKRAINTTRDGRPYLLDVRVARTGMAADSTWHPTYSVAAARTRKV